MKKVIALFVMLCGFTFVASAQDGEMKGTGFTSDIIAEMDYVSGQILKLLDAVPEDKLSWRPAEGVRSFGEVFSHIVEGNHFLLSFVGYKMPERKNDDKSAPTKAEIVNSLKKSFDIVKAEVPKVSEENLSASVDFFGHQTNQRRILILLLSHNHEHLGQAIAYSRMNGIVPPWSMTAADK